MTFNDPGGPLGVPATEFRLSDHAAVAKRFVSANADPATPGARADDRAELELFEPEGKGLAIAAALPINQRGQVTVESVGRNRIDIAIAGARDGEHFAIEMGKDHLGDK